MSESPDLTNEDALRFINYEISELESSRTKDGWTLLAAAGALLWLHLRSLSEGHIPIERYLVLLYSGYFLASAALNVVVTIFPIRNERFVKKRGSGFFLGRLVLPLGRLTSALGIFAGLLLAYLAHRVDSIMGGCWGCWVKVWMGVLLLLQFLMLKISYMEVVKNQHSAAVERFERVFLWCLGFGFLGCLVGGVVYGIKVSPTSRELLAMLPGVVVVPIVTTWLLIHDRTSPLPELTTVRRLLLSGKIDGGTAHLAAASLRFGAEKPDILKYIAGVHRAIDV